MEINTLEEILEIAAEVTMNKEERILREYIRKKIFMVRKQQLNEENRLRKVIRQLLKEGDLSDMHPHRSTAINTLEDVLKKSIPTLRVDYKRLTTDEKQRESFRAHIVNAIKDAIAPERVNSSFGLESGDQNIPSDHRLLLKFEFWKEFHLFPLPNF